MKKVLMLCVALLVLLTAVAGFAAQMRVFVGEISTPGVKSSTEMKQMLQTLLASRLNGDQVITVENAADAEIVVGGTYIVLGNSYSLDAVAKTSSGTLITRAFVQGEKDGDIIPAIGTLAGKLSAGLLKAYPAGQPSAGASHPPAVMQPVAAADTTQNGGFVTPVAQGPKEAGDWLSKRLNGAANLVATGKTLPGGSREIILAEGSGIACYRQGTDMTLVSEAELGDGYKIISLDTIAGDNDSIDIYVTAIHAGELASQVWQIKDDKLVQVQAGLRYYFRAFKLAGGPKKLYAQAMGRGDDFYGDVAEATRNGARITLKNPLKMPRYGNIYTFNQFRDQDGKLLTVVINPDNYLVVFDQGLKELWRSKDKFGGSELYFQRDDIANMRETGSRYRWIFMNQRIQVSSGGDIFVGRNDGFWVMGISRFYDHGSVYCLSWNGSGLDEKWHTRETRDYMADYSFEEPHNELLILQTVQRPGIASRGVSSLLIKKVSR